MKKRILKNGLYAIVLSFSSLTSFAGHLTGSLQFSARMNGAQEVPAVTTNAYGVSTFTLSKNRDSLCFSLSTTGLSGPSAGVHIHEAAAGQNGGVVLDLSSYIFGNQGNGVITGAVLTPAFIEKMLNGQFYVNLHTNANMNGEVRGQIKLETDAGYVANLSGNQQVPAVATTAYGLGLFNLALFDTKLDIKIVVQGLSGAITGAHLHTGAAGVAGGVAIDLSSFVNGNIIIATVDPTSFLTDLKAGNIYINIHTASNPNGEIRGQVLLPNTIFIDAMLNGAQEVPAVSTNAYGVATFGLSKTFDQITFDIVADGLSGPITGAHLHNGALGAAGGVAVDLSSSISGNRITGTISGAAVTNTLITNILTGDIYINVHTAANPGGEIRGQVYRLAREGYALLLDGNQEVPAVSTTANGGGMVSISRDQTDAHYMLVASGLSGSLDGAHFHNAASGQNGGVIFDLTSKFSNNGAFGYLKSTDTAPFTTASSVMFRNGTVYLNVHTAANPNGEIRGQVVRGAICSFSTLAVNENELENNILNIYPNPTSNAFTVKTNNSSKLINIVDITGKTVLTIKTTGTSTLVSVTSLNNGIYFVNVDGNSSTSTKIVKN